MSPDTSPATDAQLGALFRQRTAGQRLRMAMSAFEMGKMLAAAGLRRADDALAPAEARIALARRLHGNDLPIGFEEAMRVAEARRRG